MLTAMEVVALFKIKDEATDPIRRIALTSLIANYSLAETERSIDLDKRLLAMLEAIRLTLGPDAHRRIGLFYLGANQRALRHARRNNRR
jgi:hypothetical protein